MIVLGFENHKYDFTMIYQYITYDVAEVFYLETLVSLLMPRKAFLDCNPELAPIDDVLKNRFGLKSAVEANPEQG
jgi:hypothetical protein